MNPDTPHSKTFLTICVSALGVVLASIIALSVIPGNLTIPMSLIQSNQQKTNFDVILPSYVDKDTFVFLNPEAKVKLTDYQEAWYGNFFYAKDKNAAYLLYVRNGTTTNPNVSDAYPHLTDYQEVPVYTLKKIEGADPSTLKLVKINPEYLMKMLSSTSEYDYCNNSIDGRTGRAIPYDECKAKEEKIAMESYASSSVVVETYAKDTMHVYWGTDVVDGAEPATFGLMHTKVGKDYVSWDPIVMPWNSLARDKNRLYFRGMVIEGAHVDSFKQIESTPYGYGSAYAKDDARVYYSSGSLPVKAVPSADPATFELLFGEWQGGKNTTSYDYAFDKNNVYYKEGLVRGADRASFVALDSVQPVPRQCEAPDVCSRDARDKNTSYYKGKAVQ